MAKNSADEKLAKSLSTENEEEEALSLSCLPIKEETQLLSTKEEAESVGTGEDFEFGSWIGSVLTESEMCAADEVFFRGQILPLDHSARSENGLAKILPSRPDPIRIIPRSAFMDGCNLGVFAGASSRSSSMGVQNSSSSGSSTCKDYKQIVRNEFHSHPSSTPQIRIPRKAGRRSRKSATWSFFKVGLVRTPGNTELHELKARGRFGKDICTETVYRKSASDRKGCDSDKKRKQRFLEKNGAMLLAGCRRSVDAVEAVHLRGSLIRGKNGNEEQAKEGSNNRKTKQVMSCRRTFECLNELSLAEGPCWR